MAYSPTSGVYSKHNNFVWALDPQRCTSCRLALMHSTSESANMKHDAVIVPAWAKNKTRSHAGSYSGLYVPDPRGRHMLDEWMHDERLIKWLVDWRNEMSKTCKLLSAVSWPLPSVIVIYMISTVVCVARLIVAAGLVTLSCSKSIIFSSSFKCQQTRMQTPLTSLSLHIVPIALLLELDVLWEHHARLQILFWARWTSKPPASDSKPPMQA